MLSTAPLVLRGDETITYKDGNLARGVYLLQPVEASAPSAHHADDRARAESWIDVALEMGRWVDVLQPDPALGSVEKPPVGVFEVMRIQPQAHVRTARGAHRLGRAEIAVAQLCPVGHQDHLGHLVEDAVDHRPRLHPDGGAGGIQEHPGRPPGAPRRGRISDAPRAARGRPALSAATPKIGAQATKKGI